MTKVYVVTAGQYSDYHIIGVYSKKELAEEVVRKHNEYGGWYEARVEEYELDKVYPMKKVCVVMSKDGEVLRTYQMVAYSKDEEYILCDEDFLKVCELNIDLDKLIKKVSEIRTIALNEGIWGDCEKIKLILKGGNGERVFV